MSINPIFTADSRFSYGTVPGSNKETSRWFVSDLSPNQKQEYFEYAKVLLVPGALDDNNILDLVSEYIKRAREISGVEYSRSNINLLRNDILKAIIYWSGQQIFHKYNKHYLPNNTKVFVATPGGKGYQSEFEKEIKNAGNGYWHQQPGIEYKAASESWAGVRLLRMSNSGAGILNRFKNASINYLVVDVGAHTVNLSTFKSSIDAKIDNRANEIESVETIGVHHLDKARTEQWVGTGVSKSHILQLFAKNPTFLEPYREQIFNGTPTVKVPAYFGGSGSNLTRGDYERAYTASIEQRLKIHLKRHFEKAKVTSVEAVVFFGGGSLIPLYRSTIFKWLAEQGLANKNTLSYRVSSENARNGLILGMMVGSTDVIQDPNAPRLCIDIGSRFIKCGYRNPSIGIGDALSEDVIRGLDNIFLDISNEVEIALTDVNAARKAMKESNRSEKVESERKMKEEADRKAREEADRRAKEEADRKAREEADRNVKEEADRRAKEEADRNVKEEADRKAKEEADRKAKEEADRKAKEVADRKAKEEADRKAKEVADRKAREEADRKAKEEADRKAKEEADRKAKEEADRKAKEEADRKAREEADRKAKEDSDRKAKEDADRDLSNDKPYLLYTIKHGAHDKWMATDAVTAITNAIVESGKGEPGQRNHDLDVVAHIAACMGHRSILLLLGNPGTGKTTSLRRLHRHTDHISIHEITVRPSWEEPEAFLGYRNPLSPKEFVPSPFLDAIEEATRDLVLKKPRLHVVLLEEIDNTHDGFLADYLQVLDPRRADEDNIPRRLRLASKLMPCEINGHPIPAQIIIPDNLVVVGTLNYSESKAANVSRRLLSRSLLWSSHCMNGESDEAKSGIHYTDIGESDENDTILPKLYEPLHPSIKRFYFVDDGRNDIVNLYSDNRNLPLCANLYKAFRFIYMQSINNKEIKVTSSLVSLMHRLAFARSLRYCGTETPDELTKIILIEIEKHCSANTTEYGYPIRETVKAQKSFGFNSWTHR